MTQLLFVRHGESKSNEGGFFTGQTDVPLSDLGREQAAALKEYILHNYRIEKIYSSDLQRAYSTVLPIAQALHLPVQKEKMLREIYGGEWEEKTVQYIQEHFPHDYAMWHDDIGLSRCTGGESMLKLQHRAIKIVNKIAAENDGKTVLIGTHAGFLRAMLCYWKGLPPEKMREIPWVPNASVTQVEYSEGKYQVLFAGESSFLQGMITKLAKGM